MKRSTILLFALSAVLLFGIAPAAADKECSYSYVYEDEEYSCTKYRTVRRCSTESYSCEKTRRVRRCTTTPYNVTHCRWVDETYTGTCYRQVCRNERESYTDTCTRSVRVRRCTGSVSHTHSVYCTMPSGASAYGYHSGNVSGVSDYTSTYHDPNAECQAKRGRAEAAMRADPMETCSFGYTDASGSHTVNLGTMKRSACSSAESSWLSDNPACSCSYCDDAGLSGDGNRMSTSACGSLNSGASQWVAANPECTCSLCGEANLDGDGERMSTSACQAKNDEAYNATHPVCSCSHCDEAEGFSGNGTRMRTAACDSLRAGASQWLAANPECSCSLCSEANLDGDGERMSTSACQAKNDEAYNATHPVCSCSHCDEAEGFSGNGTRMRTAACDSLKAGASQWLAANPECSCSLCSEANLDGDGERMSTSACQAKNDEAYNATHPVCSCSHCDEAEGFSGNGTRMRTAACDSLKAGASQWLAANPECSCSLCGEANLDGDGERMSTSACQAKNDEAYNATHPVCSCSHCDEAEGFSGNGTRMRTAACDSLRAGASQWLAANPECSCSLLQRSEPGRRRRADEHQRLPGEERRGVQRHPPGVLMQSL